jgi:hypothetical protein
VASILVASTQLAHRRVCDLSLNILKLTVCSEIDTFEHWNMELHNQMTLHTDPGCTQASPLQTSNVINSTDCSYLDNSNAGCGVMDPADASYGAKFAAAQGGVFVTEFASSGIS